MEWTAHRMAIALLLLQLKTPKPKLKTARLQGASAPLVFVLIRSRNISAVM
jgi:hypothetical protein